MITIEYSKETQEAVCKIEGNAENVAREYAALNKFMEENYPSIKWYAEKFIEEGVNII